MDDKLQQKDIQYLQKEFDRLENTMVGGFAEIKAQLNILARNYMTREEIERALETKASCHDVERVEKETQNQRELLWKVSLAVTAISSIIGVGGNFLF